MNFFQAFWNMLWLRPYVFVPFLLFLYFGSKEIGWKRILVWTGVGYTLAFLSEFSSVRTGFPYGWYYYVKLPTADREIWVTNVPLWDSLSYVFLSYWSFCAARALIQEPVFGPAIRKQFPWRTWLLGSGLMTLADLIIDPVALRGDRWFLGPVYGYPEWGPYFGIPLENFAGWLLVSAAILGSMLGLEAWKFHSLPLPKPSRHGVRDLSWIFYLGIVGFNILLALYLKEYLLVLCDLLVFSPILLGLLWRQEVILPHLRSFRVR